MTDFRRDHWLARFGRAAAVWAPCVRGHTAGRRGGSRRRAHMLTRRERAGSEAPAGAEHGARAAPPGQPRPDAESCSCATRGNWFHIAHGMACAAGPMGGVVRVRLPADAGLWPSEPSEPEHNNRHGTAAGHSAASALGKRPCSREVVSAVPCLQRVAKKKNTAVACGNTCGYP